MICSAGAVTFSENEAVAGFLRESLRVTAMLNVPTAVGEPEKAPVLVVPPEPIPAVTD